MVIGWRCDGGGGEGKGRVREVCTFHFEFLIYMFFLRTILVLYTNIFSKKDYIQFSCFTKENF